MALWGGRFDGKASPLFRAFNDSLRFDKRLVEQDITGSIAWAKAIQGVGVISKDELSKLTGALSELLALVRANPAVLDAAADEDVHSWVERELVARVGDLGKKLHTGRSRNDQVATDLRLWTRACSAGLREAVRGLQVALVGLAERELAAGTVVPGYTHLQRGQPVLLAHWALAYVSMLDRDAARFADADRRASVSPLGCGALAGTAYPIDRESLAKELGFERPAENSLDAVSDRDFVFETLSACALCSLHLSRLAEDLILYSSSEFAFVQMDDAVTSGSSLMPQKKNPDAMELIRGKSGRVLGDLVSLATTLKGLPLAYNKDLQEDKEPLFDATDHLGMCLALATACVSSLRVNRDRCKAAADDGLIAATDLADYLVRKGVPFRDAHHTSGQLVRRAIDLGCTLSAMPIAEMKKIEPRIESDVVGHMTAEAMLNKRDAFGGTSLRRVGEMIRHWQATLGANA